MVRSICCRKLQVKKDLWTDEENLAFACNQGKVSWNGIAKKTGLRRCGKSCTLRWTNYLKPDFSNASFNLQEEELIIRLHATIGSRWTIIAQQLPGRTDNDVKNYWNSKLRKKLTDMGIDPVTHRPFSQVLADYGSIGGLPKTTNRTTSLSKDFKNPVFTKHDQFPYLKTHSGDLLSELQAVKMVADASSLVSKSASSSSSSSSSSSASCSTGFSWRDFLQEDVILQTEFLTTEQENGDELPMTVPASEKTEEGGGKQCSRNEEEASLFCHGSRFIEAMVDQDDKMLLDFRDLLEEPF